MLLASVICLQPGQKARTLTATNSRTYDQEVSVPSPGHSGSNEVLEQFRTYLRRPRLKSTKAALDGNTMTGNQSGKNGGGDRRSWSVKSPARLILRHYAGKGRLSNTSSPRLFGRVRTYGA